MLTKNKKGLLVIENFFVDKELPKFNRKDKKEIHSSAYVMDNENPDFGVSVGGFSDDGYMTNFGGIIRHDPKDEALWDGLSVSTKNELARQFTLTYYDYIVGNKIVKGNFLIRFIWCFISKLYMKKIIKTANGGIEEFFIDIKQSNKQLSKVDEKLKSYKDYLEKIKLSGQKALLEKVKESIYIAGREAVMYACGFNKYFEEKQIVEFVLKTQRGLRMDWIKNFTRHIPDDVMELKIKCDEMDIFDNYCILHYDPDGKSADLTKKEKERRKDPVLFGLLRGSSNLYFVGDWIDEYCDLTLDKITQKVGKNKKITKEYKP